jgi:hypothetical protein
LEATKRNLAHIPNIEGILKTIKGKSYATISNIITLLADISIICTTRNAMRCFPPPNAIAKFLAMKEDLVGDEGFNYTPALSDITYWETTSIHTLLGFSGLSAFLFYNSVSDADWVFCSKFTPEESAQVIFHCWFGTYKEDFGILKGITTLQTWMKRDELKDRFTKPNMEGTNKVITLPKMTYYSKMSSASQTGELAQGFKQLASIPCFSGTRIRQFSSEFFKYLEESSPSSVSQLTIQGIESDLSTILRNLVEKLKKADRQQQCGTTSWFKISENRSVEQMADYKKQIPDPTFVAREEGIYFLG